MIRLFVTEFSMRNRVSAFTLALAFLTVGCSSSPQFWRPISEPNVLLPSNKLQVKLGFDLSQCKCGIYPANISHDDNVAFQADRQRLMQTALTEDSDAALEDEDKEENNSCKEKPSLVVTECMRSRGWEPTHCAGRMSLPNGGALCAEYDPD
jgi:hypothetical protein